MDSFLRPLSKRVGIGIRQLTIIPVDSTIPIGAFMWLVGDIRVCGTPDNL